MCKFGKFAPVGATYVRCTLKQEGISDIERMRKERDHLCLMCDNSPTLKKDEEAGTYELQISVTGDFSDSLNSMPFMYYKPPEVLQIRPPYGPKDGGTRV